MSIRVKSNYRKTKHAICITNQEFRKQKRKKNINDNFGDFLEYIMKLKLPKKYCTLEYFESIKQNVYKKVIDLYVSDIIYEQSIENKQT